MVAVPLSKGSALTFASQKSILSAPYKPGSSTAVLPPIDLAFFVPVSGFLGLVVF